MAKLKDIDLQAVGNTILLAGAIYVGEGKTFLCFFPGERDPSLPLEDLEMDRADWETFIRQTDLMETTILEKAADGTLTKAVVRKSQRQIDAAVMWKVWRRDGYRCRYCGGDDVPLTVDHLVVWEEGGPTIDANLVSACKKCNKVRGNLPYEEWLRHPRYRDLSRRLPEEVRAANEALVPTLAGIPRYVNRKSR